MCVSTPLTKKSPLNKYKKKPPLEAAGVFMCRGRKVAHERVKSRTNVVKSRTNVVKSRTNGVKSRKKAGKAPRKRGSGGRRQREWTEMSEGGGGTRESGE